MFTRQMLLKPKHTDNVKDIVFFIVCKMYKFSFGFIEAFDSKGLINTLKMVLREPWNALTSQLSLSLGDR